MAAYLGFLKAKARRQTALEQLPHEVAAIDAGLAHRGERRREISLGETAAILVHDQRVVQIAGSDRPSSVCKRRWIGVDGRKSAPRTTIVTPLAASSTTQERW